MGGVVHRMMDRMVVVRVVNRATMVHRVVNRVVYLCKRSRDAKHQS